MNLFNKTLVARIKEIVPYCVGEPGNVDVALNTSYSIDFSSSSVVLQQWMDGLAIYTPTSLGLSNANLNLTFSTNVSYPYFLVNCNTEHLWCYSEDSSFISTSLWLQNFT